jgi:hypothetical protein
LRHFNSALQARKQVCSYLSLVHESLKIFDLACWWFGKVLRNLTVYQMMRLRWGASQVPANARNRSSPYPIWGLNSLIAPFQPPRSIIFFADYGPHWEIHVVERNVDLLSLSKLCYQPKIGSTFSPPPFLLFGLKSRTLTSRWLQMIFQLRTIFYPGPGRFRNSRSSEKP